MSYFPYHKECFLGKEFAPFGSERTLKEFPILKKARNWREYENIKNVIHEWGYMYKMNNISAAFSHS